MPTPVYELTILLTELSIDSSAFDSEGKTALRSVAEAGEVSVIGTLAKVGVKINVNLKGGSC